MKKISIEYLKNEDYVDYIDGDIFLIEDVETIKMGAVEVEAIIVIFCLNGIGQVSMNGSKYEMKRNQLMICMPHAVFSNYQKLTDNFEAKIIGISTHALNSSVSMSKNIWKNFYYLLNNPIINVSEDEVELLSHYYELANLKMHGERSPFHQTIMMSLIHAVIFELLAFTDKMNINEFEEEHQKSQSDVLFKNFLQLLAEHEGRIRSVQDYADILCVSPKYLSAVVKQMSGRTALAFIHETTIHAIVRQLKYTDKPIKQISDEMQFPSLSFFGKFVKSQLGVSPKQFRKGD